MANYYLLTALEDRQQSIQLLLHCLAGGWLNALTFEYEADINRVLTEAKPCIVLLREAADLDNCTYSFPDSTYFVLDQTIERPPENNGMFSHNAAEVNYQGDSYPLFSSWAALIGHLIFQRNPTADSVFDDPQVAVELLANIWVKLNAAFQSILAGKDYAYQKIDEFRLLADDCWGYYVDHKVKNLLAEAEEITGDPINDIDEFEHKVSLYRQVYRLAPEQLAIFISWRDELFEIGHNIEAEFINQRINLQLKKVSIGLNALVDEAKYHFNNGDYARALGKLDAALREAGKYEAVSGGFFNAQQATVHHIYGLVRLDQDFGPTQDSSKHRFYDEAEQHLVQAVSLRRTLTEQVPKTIENTSIFLELAQSLLALSTLYLEVDPKRFPELAARSTQEAEQYCRAAVRTLQELSVQDRIIWQNQKNAYTLLADILPRDHTEQLAIQRQIQLFDRQLEEGQKVSVFLSYNSEDTARKNEIKTKLLEAGIHVEDYQVTMQPGETITGFIERSLETNQYTIQLISQNSLLSGWVAEEAIQSKQFQKFGQHVYIPCLLDDSLFEPNFIGEVRTRTAEQLKIIRQEMKDRLNNEGPIEDLFRRFQLQNTLHHNIAKLVSDLQGIGCRDLTKPGELDHLIDQLLSYTPATH